MLEVGNSRLPLSVARRSSTNMKAFIILDSWSSRTDQSRSYIVVVAVIMMNVLSSIHIAGPDPSANTASLYFVPGAVDQCRLTNHAHTIATLWLRGRLLRPKAAVEHSVNVRRISGFACSDPAIVDDCV